MSNTVALVLAKPETPPAKKKTTTGKTKTTKVPEAKEPVPKKAARKKSAAKKSKAKTTKQKKTVVAETPQVEEPQITQLETEAEVPEQPVIEDQPGISNPLAQTTLIEEGTEPGDLPSLAVKPPTPQDTPEEKAEGVDGSTVSVPGDDGYTEKGATQELLQTAAQIDPAPETIANPKIEPIAAIGSGESQLDETSTLKLPDEAQTDDEVDTDSLKLPQPEEPNLDTDSLKLPDKGSSNQAIVIDTDSLEKAKVSSAPHLISPFEAETIDRDDTPENVEFIQADSGSKDEFDTGPLPPDPTVSTMDTGPLAIEPVRDRDLSKKNTGRVTARLDLDSLPEEPVDARSKETTQELDQETDDKSDTPADSGSVEPVEDRSIRNILLDKVSQAVKPKIDTSPLEELRKTEGAKRALERYPQPSADVSPKDNSLIARLNLPAGSAGLLEILDDDPNREWSEDERILVAQVADQLGLALENANLFQQTQQALSETDALYQASAELNAANEYDEVLAILRSYTLMGLNCTLMSVNIFEFPWTENKQPEWFEVLRVWDPQQKESWGTRTRLNSFPSIPKLLRSDEIVLLPDLPADPRLGDNARNYFRTAFDAQSALFIPIVSGGQWIGFLDAFFNRKQKFLEADVRRMNSIATQAIEKIVSIRLSKLTSARRANADQLNELAREFGEILSLDSLRDRLVYEINKRLQPDGITMYSWDGEQRAFLVQDQVLADPTTPDNLEHGMLVKADDRPDLVDVFRNDRARYEAVEWTEGLLREQFLLPWGIGEVVQGVIEVHHTARGLAITDLDQEFINGLVLQAASSMERARLFEQTQAALALTDEQARRLAVLNTLSSELGTAQDLQEVCRISIARTHDIFPSERLSLTLLNPAQTHVEVVEVFETTDAVNALQKGQMIAVEGTANQIAIREGRVLLENNDPNASVRSYIIGPLTAGGEVLGTLNIGSRQPYFFNDQDTNFMNQLVAVISSAMENRKLFQAIQDSLSSSEEQARRLAELNQMSESLAVADSLETVLSIAAKRLNSVVPFEYASFAFLSEDQSKFRVYSLDPESGVKTEFENFPRRGTLAHQVIIENQLLTVGDVDEFDHSDTKLMKDRGIHSMMYIPISASNVVIGTLNLGMQAPHAYTLRDESLMISVGSFLSSTIDNRELLGQIQRRSAQLEASAEVSRVASTILDSVELLPRVVNLIKDGFGLYYCGLFLVDNDGAWTGEPGKWAVLQAGTGEAGNAMLMEGHKLEMGGNSMIGTAVATKVPRIALDVGAERVFFRNPHLPNTRSEMALPLISRGEVIGALTIQSDLESAFSPEDITALQTLADQVANTIENARLFEETEERAEELAVLNEMARAFTQTLDETSVIESTYEYTSKLMNADNFYLALYDSTNKVIDFKLFTENGQRIPPPEPRVAMGEGLTDWIITNRQAVLMADNPEAQMQEMGLLLRGTPSQSYLGVPMLRGDEVLGVIAVQSFSQPRAYGANDRDLLTAVANQVTIAIENSRLFMGTQARARREQLLREITARVHSSADPEIILRTAVREVSQALGRKAFIQLQPDENGKSQDEFSNAVMPGLKEGDSGSFRTPQIAPEEPEDTSQTPGQD
jgi:GAF domain-containing protein